MPKKPKNQVSLTHSILKGLKSPQASAALDILVILSLLLNVYSFMESARLNGELNLINNQLTLLNRTLEKTAQDIDPTPQTVKLNTVEDPQCPTIKQT